MARCYRVRGTPGSVPSSLGCLHLHEKCRDTGLQKTIYCIW